MREVKYQAWDNVKKRMYSVGEESDIHFELTSGGIVAYDLNEEQDSPDYKMEHLEYRQFTGLIDKNGVEIYENDILKWDESEWGSPYNELVEWNYDQFHIRASDWEEWCEVVGNIYENPELLGNKR